MAKQRYVGNVTVVPRLTFLESFGFNAIRNPTLKHMSHYLLEGERATWPHVERIKHLYSLEKRISENIEKIRNKIDTKAPSRKRISSAISDNGDPDEFREKFHLIPSVDFPEDNEAYSPSSPPKCVSSEGKFNHLKDRIRRLCEYHNMEMAEDDHIQVSKLLSSLNNYKGIPKSVSLESFKIPN